MEQKTAQLRAKPKVISQYGYDIFWETPSRARFLVDTGQFVLVNAGPSEARVAGPSETKPSGPQEKKMLSSDEADGPLTDFQKSQEPGTDVRSSALVGDHHSPLTNADLLPKRGPGRPRKSE